MSGGYQVRPARAYWAARLPLPCARCGNPVTADGTGSLRMTVEHLIERDRGLADPNDVTLQWVAHAHCNFAAGAKYGHDKKNSANSADQNLNKF